jgi:hypothetical protein
MWITPALAHATTGADGTSGGGIMLLFLLGIGATILLLMHAKNRWRAGRSTRSEV